MTELQKAQIKSMRKQKITYSAISDALGIPVNTIKTFCRRNGMTTPMTKEKPVCKNCGAELSITPGAKQRIFCSDRCRQTWWNKHRNDRTSEKLTHYTCLTCGKSFVDYSGASRKYCSSRCYQERNLPHEA